MQGIWAATWVVALPAYDHLDELALRVERCLGVRGERYKFTNDPVDDAEQWPGEPEIRVTAENAGASGELQLMVVTKP